MFTKHMAGDGNSSFCSSISASRQAKLIRSWWNLILLCNTAFENRHWHFYKQKWTNKSEMNGSRGRRSPNQLNLDAFHRRIWHQSSWRVGSAPGPWRSHEIGILQDQCNLKLICKVMHCIRKMFIDLILQQLISITVISNKYNFFKKVWQCWMQI